MLSESSRLFRPIRHRSETAAAQTLSDPDRDRAYSTYLSYCGTYTVEGNTVTHHVKAGLRLNQELFFNRPLTLVPVEIIALRLTPKSETMSVNRTI